MFKAPSNPMVIMIRSKTRRIVSLLIYLTLFKGGGVLEAEVMSCQVVVCGLKYHVFSSLYLHRASNKISKNFKDGQLLDKEG